MISFWGFYIILISYCAELNDRISKWIYIQNKILIVWYICVNTFHSCVYLCGHHFLFKAVIVLSDFYRSTSFILLVNLLEVFYLWNLPMFIAYLSLKEFLYLGSIGRNWKVAGLNLVLKNPCWTISIVSASVLTLSTKWKPEVNRLIEHL